MAHTFFQLKFLNRKIFENKNYRSNACLKFRQMGLLGGHILMQCRTWAGQPGQLLRASQFVIIGAHRARWSILSTQ